MEGSISAASSCTTRELNDSWHHVTSSRPHFAYLIPVTPDTTLHPCNPRKYSADQAQCTVSCHDLTLRPPPCTPCPPRTVAQDAGLKVKEYELIRKNFSESGNFGGRRIDVAAAQGRSLVASGLCQASRLQHMHGGRMHDFGLALSLFPAQQHTRIHSNSHCTAPSLDTYTHTSLERTTLTSSFLH
jgi:hypothetical protein